MNWYAAHLIMYFKYRHARQRSFLVWENVVLIHAADSEEAYAKAERRGREEEACDDETLTMGGRPAKMLFAGVRKVTLCVDPHERPGDGTEVTYNEMRLTSERAVFQFAAGKSTRVTLDVNFASERDELPAEVATQRLAK